VIKIEHNVDRRTNLPMEMGYITFKEKSDAEKAIEYMDKAQLDGIEVRLQFTLPYQKQQRGGSPRRNNNRPAGRWRRSPSPLRGGRKVVDVSPPTRKRNLSPRGNSPSPKRPKDDH